MIMTIEEIKHLRESEDHVEFKEAKTQFNYNQGRKSILGYIVALANEGGGKLILGVAENSSPPHEIVGSIAWEDKEGELEQNIYRDLAVRIKTEVLHEADKRVLILYIATRPVGHYLTFEDVALMRVGEALLPMDQNQIRRILTEEEGDFSSTICAGLGIADLDENALKTIKAKYAEKQNNRSFANQPHEQVLIDLDLMRNGQLTYASLILLGKREKIKELLPQCAVHLEYRDNPDNVPFDKCNIFQDPYFLLIDDLLRIIDVRNKTVKIQIGAYIRDIPELNVEVIRESINNAVAHRDYKKASEIVIKQSSKSFVVQSHGGFPLGVNVNNILTTNSTPRNRLLADVLTKTGLVERSGQGVDKIFKHNLSEGKGNPSYDLSDLFQVTLHIPIEIDHPVFALFVRDIESRLPEGDILGVRDVIVLVKVRESQALAITDEDSASKLENIQAIKPIATEGRKYVLGEKYSELIRAREGSDRNRIIDFISDSVEVKMGDILELFENRLTRRQVQNIVFKLVEDGVLQVTGTGKSTTYQINMF